MLVYLSCSSSLVDWYPDKPNGRSRHWVNPQHPDVGCWRTLNIATDSPTTFGFAVVAGAAGVKPPSPTLKPTPQWPSPTAEPWFVIQAAGDADRDQLFSLFVSSSFSGDVYVQNEIE